LNPKQNSFFSFHILFFVSFDSSIFVPKTAKYTHKKIKCKKAEKYLIFFEKTLDKRNLLWYNIKAE